MKYLYVGDGRGAINGERGGIPRVFYQFISKYL